MEGRTLGAVDEVSGSTVLGAIDGTAEDTTEGVKDDINVGRADTTPGGA
jgi:hypothetical protein